MLIIRLLIAIAMLAGMLGCGAGWPSPRMGDEIIVSGRLFHTGTRVITYLDPQGYNAYRCYNHFDPTQYRPKYPADGENPNRYGPTRGNVAPELQAAVDKQGWTLENLRQQVDKIVIHYDACGTSQECFFILHDRRGLSSHFMIDLDGTVYQTLDITERAWHATIANDRGVGVEVSNMGVQTSPDKLSKWYTLGPDGWPVVNYAPEDVPHRELRTPSFVARPARKQPVSGVIHGKTLYQYDFTNEQYAALIKLLATLHRVLPGISLTIPRGPDGKVDPNILPEECVKTFRGILGHWHISKVKVDPGPALDWDRILNGARFAP